MTDHPPLFAAYARIPKEDGEGTKLVLLGSGHRADVDSKVLENHLFVESYGATIEVVEYRPVEAES